MKKQLSDKPLIASLVMGITLSATVNAQNLLCGIIDGEGSNDAIAILQVNKLGIARGALCYVDLASPTTLENCHPVTGIATGVQQIKIALQGQGLDAQGKLATTGASFTYIPTATYTGLGAAQTGDGGNAGNGAVEGIAYAVRCKATKARGRQEPRYTIVVNPTALQVSNGVLPGTFECPSDTADTFTGPSISPKRPNGTSYAPGNSGGVGGVGGVGGNGGNGGAGGSAGG